MRLVFLLALTVFAPCVSEGARLVKGKRRIYPFTVDKLGEDPNHPAANSDPSPTNQTKAGDEAPSTSSHVTKASASLRAGKMADMGTTVCQCVCGERVVWHRELFKGNVETEQEKYCKEDLCPRVMVPGLKVVSQCSYHANSAEVTGGTVCNCDCGAKRLWQNKMFYGDVGPDKERECIEDICPRHAVPGLKSTAKCTYQEDLFAKDKAMGPSGIFLSEVLLLGFLSIVPHHL